MDFAQVANSHANLLEQEKMFYKRIGLVTNMAAVSLR